MTVEFEVVNLGHGSNILTFDEFSVLVNLGINQDSLRHFAPPFSESDEQGWLQPIKLHVPSWHRCPLVHDAGAILLSHPAACLALPCFLRDVNFIGHIFCSSPVLTQAKFLLQEFQLAAMERTGSCDPRAPVPKSDKAFADFYLNEWLNIYSEQELEDAIEQIEVLDLNRPQNLCAHVTVTAVSSGYSVGAYNWLFEFDSTTVLYVGNSSLQENRCPAVMDLSERVQSPDYLVLNCGLRPRPANIGDAQSQLKQVIETTLKRRGNLLLAVDSFQMVLDWLKQIVTAVAHSGLPREQQRAISVVGFHKEFKHADRFGEWLSPALADQIYQNPPRAPFVWQPLMQHGRIKSFAGLHEIDDETVDGPSIVLVQGSHLRFEPAAALVGCWSQDENSVFVLPKSPEFIGGYSTDKDASNPAPPPILRPYQPVLCEVLQVDLDVGLSVSDAKRMITRLSPKHFIYVPPVAPASTNAVRQTLGDIVPASVSYNSPSKPSSPASPKKKKTFKALKPLTIQEYAKIPSPEV